MTSDMFPVGGPRQAVYNALTGRGFVGGGTVWPGCPKTGQPCRILGRKRGAE